MKRTMRPLSRRQNVEKIQEFCKSHIVDMFMCVAVLFFAVGCWCLYTANRTANDYHDIHDTVQQAERDNQQARQQIGNASAEIDSAQKQLSVSIKRTGEITERTKQVKRRVDDNSRIIGECQTLIEAGRRDAEEARSIFADIDERNKVNGAQTDSHA